MSNTSHQANIKTKTVQAHDGAPCLRRRYTWECSCGVASRFWFPSEAAARQNHDDVVVDLGTGHEEHRDVREEVKR